MTHFFLTGQIHVGKSTLLRRVLELGEYAACGFATHWLPEAEGRALWLHAYEGPMQAGQIVTRQTAAGMERFPAVFDRLGPELLAPKADAQFLVMDELGTLEGAAAVFQQAVLRALDGPLPVLGVIKPKQSPFLDAVRAHPGVRLYTVTAENRNALTDDLLEALEACLPESRL